MLHDDPQEEVLVVMKGQGAYFVLEPEKDKEHPEVYPMRKNTSVTIPANTLHQVGDWWWPVLQP